MTDLPSSLGIEAVELLAEGGRGVTVRVIGRWRRRRPELRGQPMLVVDGVSGRQRFLAMPEPPSLTGAAPGTWRMSFSVPAELAPELPGRTYLQLGGVMVPLPVGELPPAGGAADPDLLEARRARSSELAAESARRRAAELEGEVSRLERELEQARGDSARLEAEVAERERRLRVADQHAHAERALRAEVEQQLSRRSRAAQHDLRVMHERLDELERELTRMRRAVDEAQHLASVAQAARAESERRLAERTAPELAPSPSAPSAPPALPASVPPQPDRSTGELVLLRATPAVRPAARRVALSARGGDRGALRAEASMAQARGARVAALELELVAAREEADAQRRRSDRAYEAIERVRAELRLLQIAAPPAAPAQPRPAQPPPAEPPPAGPAPAATPVPSQPVQADRLNEALARLRDRTPAPPAEEAAESPAEPPAAPRAEPDPPAAAPATPPKPWLEAAFRRLTERDPAAAGRLLLALLPAQRAADPHAVAYDLVLDDLMCARVTVGSGSIDVELAQVPRPAAEVDFQLVGDGARVARLLVAGGLRRRLPSRRRARIRGDRRRVAALDHLVRARLGLPELIGAGVRLDPPLALMLAASAIEPGWTVGERFTLAHRDPALEAPGAYLQVRDGREPAAGAEAPHSPVAGVVVCPAQDLLGVLAGRGAPLEGEQRPLDLVRQWLVRAQRG